MNFDKNVDKYYIYDLLSTLDNRNEKTFENMKTRNTISNSRKKKKEKNLI